MLTTTSTHPNYDLLKELIERNSAATLTLPSAGMMRQHTTRFLAETEDGFWVESIAGEQALIEQLMAEESPVGVACKSGDRSLAFAVPIRAREAAFDVNPTTRAEAIFLPFPDNFRKDQRRRAYRVTLPPGHPYAVRMWRIPDHAILRDRPMAAQELVTKLKNLSVAGMGVLCTPGRDHKAPRMLGNERVRIQLTWGSEQLLLEGRVMHTRPAGDNLVVGVEFQKLDKDVEGRRAASKVNELVGLLHREELKRTRAIAVPA